MTFPVEYIPLNFCRRCGIDFTSLDAFDAHLGGSADERVHLHPIEEAGLELRDTKLGVARYGVILTEARLASLAALRAS